MGQLKTTSERIDNLPLLIYWLKRMQVDVIIDRVLGPAHGNWEGLSYGEVALVFVAYVVMGCTHFLSPMQGWARTHLVSLTQALGKGVREQDFTDDRLALLLSRLGEERLLKAFDDLTLYRHESATEVWHEVTELTPLQRRILHLLGVPESVYAAPAVLIDSG